jgi:hypothetical protein
MKSRVYHIFEQKNVVYTYKVYATSKEEALQKFNSHGDYEEIGLGPGAGAVKTTITDYGEAVDHCAECGLEYSPKNVRDYLCPDCGG